MCEEKILSPQRMFPPAFYRWSGCIYLPLSRPHSGNSSPKGLCTLGPLKLYLPPFQQQLKAPELTLELTIQLQAQGRGDI